MGETVSKSAHYEDAATLFSKEELQRIETIYKSLCGGKKTPFNVENIKEWTCHLLPGETVSKLYNYMKRIQQSEGHQGNSGSVRVSQDAFVITMAHLLKGSISERTHILCCLAADNNSASGTDLLNVVEVLSQSYFAMLETTPQFQTWQVSSKIEDKHRFAKFLLQDLFNKDNKDNVENADAVSLQHSYSEEEVEKWLSRCPVILHIMELLFRTCFKVITEHSLTSSPMIPHCSGTNWNKHSTLLSIAELIVINQNLPVELQTEWRLLFSSSIHGESFSRLIGYIAEKGPTVIVVKDTDGHVFGGFATESWSARPQFVGSSRCFLFSLVPNMGIFHATGYNEHYMYLNQHQETMPNGLGFGGQLEYYGLWLDSEYGLGHSKAEPLCTTFNSPQLSAQANFKMVHVEVWGVGPDETISKNSDDEDEAKASILDKDPEAKAMLSLMGRGPHSEGLRESDATAGNPEDHQLHGES